MSRSRMNESTVAQEVDMLLILEQWYIPLRSSLRLDPNEKKI